MLTASTLHTWLESFGMTAAWVQAWGSLLALSIAIALAFYNQTQERKREKKKQAKYMEAISLINCEGIEAASYIIHEMNSDSLRHHGITTTDLDRCIQALDSITLESLPNANAFMAVHKLRKELNGILWSATNQHDYDLGINPDVLEEVDDGLQRAVRANDEFSQALSALK